MEAKTIVQFLGYCRGGNLSGLTALLAPYDLSLIERNVVYTGIWNALKSGSEVVLEFLLNLPDYKEGYHGINFYERCWYLAHRFGTESLLKYFTYSDDTPRNPACCSVKALNGAAKRGNLTVFQQIFSRRLGDPEYQRKAVFKAARSGHIELVLWACQQNRFVYINASEGACLGAQTKLIEVLIQNGYFSLMTGISHLAQRGHLNLLKTILEQVGFVPEGGGIAWDRVAYIAVRAGHLPIAKYLVSRGVDITDFPSQFKALSTYTDNPEVTRRFLESFLEDRVSTDPILQKTKFKWPHPCAMVETAIARYDVAFIETCLRAGYDKLGLYVLTKPIPGIKEMCQALLIRGWNLESQCIHEFQAHYQVEGIELTLRLTQQRDIIDWLRQFLGPILKPNPMQLCLLYI